MRMLSWYTAARMSHAINNKTFQQTGIPSAVVKYDSLGYKVLKPLRTGVHEMKEIDFEDGFLIETETTGGFSDKYEAKEKLGAGVSSVVWRCINKTTGEEFAVKIIDKLLDQGDVDIKGATKDEIDVLLQLQEHQNIIGLVDVFESAAFFFLVFEIATRGELFDYLTEQVTLSEKKTRRMMYDVFKAVTFMHSKDIAHRDLKLENILLDGDLNIKISDFGFAVMLKEGEVLTELCGTPGYLAPEVLQCSMFPDAPGYGKEVDIWACGVMMYTLLVGFPPFWHRRQVVMLRSIMEGKYQFHSPEWDDISPAAKDLISRLLVVDPNTRITSEEALAHTWFDGVQPARNENYSARWKFKGAVLAVLAVREFQRLLQSRFQPVTFDVILSEPYGVKSVRKLIDGCAFRIYGHWVKRNKDEQQNRAALFENKPHKEKYNNGMHDSVHSDLQYELSFRMASFGHFKPTRKTALVLEGAKE